jgi:hypothetical protein
MASRKAVTGYLAAVVVTLLLGAGCSSVSGGPAAAPDPTGAGATAGPAGAYPLDEYRQSARDREVIRSAGYRRFARCMSRFGLAVPPLSAGGGARPVAPERFGLEDERHAARFGYHRAPETVVRATPPSLPAAAEAVAEGTGPASYRGRPVPRGGCFEEARQGLERGATVPPDPSLADRLDLASGRRTRTDSRVREKFGEWRHCMSRQGHAYEDPFAANNDPEFRTPEPSGPEIAVAVDDVRCKRAVGLVPVMTAVERENQRELIAENLGALARIKAFNEVVARNARAEPAAAGSPATP